MKRLVYFVVFLFCLSSVFALDISLESNSSGLESSLEGGVVLNYSDYLPGDTSIYLLLDGEEVGSLLLEEVVSSLDGVEVLEEEFSVSGSPEEESRLTFTEKGDLYVGVDLIEEESSSIFSLSQFRLDVNGLAQRGSYPRSLRLDVADDGRVDYQYKGDLISGEFEELSREYLDDEVPDFHRKIRGENSDLYCEAVVLKPTKKYLLEAYVKQLQEGGNLQLALSPFSSLSSCEDEGVSCCSLSSGESYAWQACTVDLELEEEEEYYLCLFSEGGDFEEEYYQVAGDSDSSAVSGYYNGVEAGKDFFLVASWNRFNEVLEEEITPVDISVDSVDPYLRQNSCSTGRCSLVPVKVSSETPGVVLLSNLVVDYETSSGAAGVTAFTPLNYQARRYSFDGDVEISLSDFGEVLSPPEIGVHSLEVVFNNERKSVSFDVVEGPSVHIRASPITPILGEEVRFSCLTAQDLNGTNKTCFWDFGDGFNASGLEVSHSYSSEGEFSVALKVEEDELVSVRKGFVITVQALKPSLEAQLLHSKELLERSKASRNSLEGISKETSDLLGHEGLFIALESNLTLLQDRFDQLNSSDDEVALLNLKDDLDGLLGRLPVDFSLNTFEFESKVESVPSARILDPDGSLGFSDIEGFSQSLLKAQENVVVSSSARSVFIVYASGETEEVLVVKKSIQGQGQVYELLNGLALREAFGEYSVVSQGVLKFGAVQEISYVLEEENYFDAVKAKTLVIPASLDSTGSFEEIGYCGDGICDESSETSQSCSEDCSKKRPWGMIVFLVILLIAGAYYFNFYHGPYDFDWLRDTLKRKKARDYFKNEKDYQLIKKYISSNLGRLDEIQIMFVLKKKKWTDEQVKAVLKEVKNEKRKGVKKNSFKSVNLKK